MALQIEPIDKTFSRDAFDCGTPVLNNFLQTKARQNQSKGFSRTFVIFDDEDKEKRVLGYYSVSMGEVNIEILSEAQRKGLPRHPVPVARIGRLAVDKATQGQGLGALLLVDALKRIQAVSAEIGTYAVVVDAKDESAKRFYLKYGFLPFEIFGNALFLPLSSLP
jgi:GNAT superfamily N-acetyltransferase